MCLVCLRTYCILIHQDWKKTIHSTNLNSVWIAILIVYSHVTLPSSSWCCHSFCKSSKWIACYITFVFIGVDVMQAVECVCWHVLGLQYLPGTPIHNIQPYLQVSVFAGVSGIAIRNKIYYNKMPHMTIYSLLFTFSSLSYSNKSFTMGCPQSLLSNSRITLMYMGCSKKTK